MVYLTTTLFLLSLLPRIRKRIDEYVEAKLNWLRGLCNQRKSEIDQEIEWINFLQSRIRSGKSVFDSAQRSLIELQLYGDLERSVKKLVARQEPEHASAKLVHQSVLSGAPCLDSLQKFKLNFINRRMLQKKSHAATIQFRAQGLILSVLPWALLLTQALLSPAEIKIAFASTTFQLALVLALMLTITGFVWMKRLFQNCSRPSDKLAHEFQSRLLELIHLANSSILAGESPKRILEGAQAKCLQALYSKSRSIQSSNYASIYTDLITILESSVRLGNPIQKQLTEITDQMNCQLEVDLTERTQLLPLKLLLPTMLAIFPATMLLILAPLLPQLMEVMKL